jgi:hypothetical protein
MIMITAANSHPFKFVSFQTVVAIKALGNIGAAKSIINPTLQLCIEDKQLPVEVRIAAVEAHRCKKLLAYFCTFVNLSTSIKVLLQRFILKSFIFT